VSAERVVWHDVECGSYTADLELWHELAAEAGGRVLDVEAATGRVRDVGAGTGRVLDVGAGTGRVSLRLAHGGYDVTALDRDALVLRVLERRARAAGLAVTTVVADAGGFALEGPPYCLVAVPMQTIQLLPDARARAGFFASARRAVAPGGIVALASADALEGFEPDAELPLADVAEVDGVRYVSQPTAVREIPGGVRIERLRHTVGPSGARTTEEDVVVLTAVSVAELEAEGAAAGLRPDRVRHIDPTPDHVGAEVVIMRG
jgi:SAM-dependent methyltransferase